MFFCVRRKFLPFLRLMPLVVSYVTFILTAVIRGCCDILFQAIRSHSVHFCFVLGSFYLAVLYRLVSNESCFVNDCVGCCDPYGEMRILSYYETVLMRRPL